MIWLAYYRNGSGGLGEQIPQPILGTLVGRVDMDGAGNSRRGGESRGLGGAPCARATQSQSKLTGPGRGVEPVQELRAVQQGKFEKPGRLVLLASLSLRQKVLG